MSIRISPKYSTGAGREALKPQSPPSPSSAIEAIKRGLKAGDAAQLQNINPQHLDSGTMNPDKTMIQAYIEKFRVETLRPMGEELSWPEVQRMADYDDKMINYYIMKNLLMAVGDHFASCKSDQGVQAILNTPINRVFVRLMKQKRWKAFLSERFGAAHLTKAREILEACQDS